MEPPRIETGHETSIDARESVTESRVTIGGGRQRDDRRRLRTLFAKYLIHLCAEGNDAVGKHEHRACALVCGFQSEQRCQWMHRDVATASSEGARADAVMSIDGAHLAHLETEFILANAAAKPLRFHSMNLLYVTHQQSTQLIRLCDLVRQTLP